MKATGTLLAALLLSLFLVPGADAQIWRWFGPKAPDKKATPDPRRVTEVNVEIAWLADPVTFPYYLEAHVTGAQMEVRGYVPSRAVREQALRIAQVYSSLPVVDSMKEHPSLLVKPGQLSAQQLQSSAQSSLRVALPKQAQQLKIECGGDGKVCVLGPVTTIEEKVIVSHSLRRLHGCTSVQNLTTLPSDLAQSPPNLDPLEKTPIVKTSNPTEVRDKPVVAVKPSVAVEVKSKSWFTWPFGKGGTKDEPPLAEPRKGTPPIVDVQTANEPKVAEPLRMPEVVKADVPPVSVKTPALSVAELRKRVQSACPDTKNIEVQFTSATKVRITLEIRTEKDLEPTAERLFAMPELQNYLPDLQFKISSP